MPPTDPSAHAAPGADPRTGPGRTKVLLVAGARPNFMKVAPLLRALRERGDRFQCRLVHTGQHHDPQMSEVFFRELEIPAPDHHLGAGGGTHAEQTAQVMVGFERVCLEERPDLVLVVGDVNSTLACSIVAKKLHVRVGHIEAGLRSGDLRMPEEVNRIVTDAITDDFFVSEPSGVANLLAEGKPRDRVFLVGNVMIDTLLHQLGRLGTSSDGSPEAAAFKARNPAYGVVTVHRAENVDDARVLARLFEALGAVARRLPLVLPIHPRTQARLERFGIGVPEGLTRVPPQSYRAFLDLYRDARLVLTDSGGVQEETTALGVPCLTLRENTERPITVEEGTNVLVGTSPERILAETEAILGGRGKAGRRPELWDGQAARRIVAILAERIGNGTHP